VCTKGTLKKNLKDCLSFIQQEDESSPVLAPKQKDQVKDEPVDNSPAKPAPLGHARGTPPASKSKQKRKLGVDDAKTSSGAASKKAKVELVSDLCLF
jgi:transcription initiation factor TFIIF subunit alpha